MNTEPVLSFMMERITSVRRKGGSCLEIGARSLNVLNSSPCHSWLLSSVVYFVLLSQHKMLLYTRLSHNVFKYGHEQESYLSFAVFTMGLSFVNGIV